MVIQRIQSLYLLLVVVLMSIFAFLPVFGANVDGNNLAVGALPTCGVTQPSWLLLTLDALVALLALITIFKYKDLKAQQRLCSILILLIVAVIVCIAIMFVSQKDGIAALQWSIALPFVALVFAMLAKKGVKHDRKLLSDSERIR